MHMIWPKTIHWSIWNVTWLLFIYEWLKQYGDSEYLILTWLSALTLSAAVGVRDWTRGLSWSLTFPSWHRAYIFFPPVTISQQHFLALRHKCVHEWYTSALQLYPLCLTSPPACVGVHSQVPNSLKTSLFYSLILCTVKEEVEHVSCLFFFVLLLVSSLSPAGCLEAF